MIKKENCKGQNNTLSIKSNKKQPKQKGTMTPGIVVDESEENNSEMITHRKNLFTLLKTYLPWEYWKGLTKVQYLSSSESPFLKDSLESSSSITDCRTAFCKKKIGRSCELIQKEISSFPVSDVEATSIEETKTNQDSPNEINRNDTSDNFHEQRNRKKENEFLLDPQISLESVIKIDSAKIIKTEGDQLHDSMNFQRNSTKIEEQKEYADHEEKPVQFLINTSGTYLSSPIAPLTLYQAPLSESFWTFIQSFISIGIVTAVNYQLMKIKDPETNIRTVSYSLGATSVLLHSMCHLCPSQPRNVFWGTTISAFLGVLTFQIYLVFFYHFYFYKYYDTTDDEITNHQTNKQETTSFTFYPFDLSSRQAMEQVYNSQGYLNTVWIPASLSVALATVAMERLQCLHPPGGAAAFTAVVGGFDAHTLQFLYPILPCGISVLFMIGIATIFNNFSRYRHYPMYWSLFNFRFLLPNTIKKFIKAKEAKTAHQES